MAGSRRTAELPRPLVALGVAVAVAIGITLGGVAVAADVDRTFRPDWATWAPTTVAVGLGLFGLALLVRLGRQLPQARSTGSDDSAAAPVAAGTIRAIRRGDRLTPAQLVGAQAAVDRVASRRPWLQIGLGAGYAVLGALGVTGHGGTGWIFVILGAVTVLAGGGSEIDRRRTLAAAARSGFRPSSANESRPVSR